MKFEIFVGIDQTGAVDSKGLPKPLSVSVIDHTQIRKKFFTGLKLKKLDHANLTELIQSCVPHFKNQSVLVCVDAVLGLPIESKTTIHQILKASRDYSLNKRPYGALTAHTFFNQFLKNETLPHRVIELQVKANSVFKLKPFQRNIGCGSYRILKELAESPGWFGIWPFEKAQTQFIIAEGYPTYLWKSLFGSKKRDLAILAAQFKSLHFRTLDEADSFILALGALKFESQISLKVTQIAKKEGWMLGVPF